MKQPPRWAEWNPLGAARPWTVGIEEEAFLLTPPRWTLANRIGDVLAGLPAHVADRASAETHACVVEIATRPHGTVAGAASELADLRRELAGSLQALDLRAAVCGSHPFASWQAVQLSPGARQREIHASTRELARREPTCGLHVHVAVPDGERAVRALAGLREDLPVLLALSANSPFWQGRDTGLASARLPIFSMFPRVGIPRRFETYGAYVGAVQALVGSGAIPDPSYLWWDARLQPRLGTVEVRIMDGQSGIADAAALAALVQCLVKLHATREHHEPGLCPEALDENRFLAARDGIAARLIAAGHACLEPAVERLAAMLWACRPLARHLGCSNEIDGVFALAAAPGHARQRELAQRSGLVVLAESLASEFDARRTATRSATPSRADAVTSLLRAGTTQ